MTPPHTGPFDRSDPPPVELVDLDVRHGFTVAVRGRIVSRTIVFGPASAGWPATPRIEQVSFNARRIGVCRSWLPDPRLADLNRIPVPEAALLHLAAGITGARAHITTLTVSTRPAGPDDVADLDLSDSALPQLGGVAIVQIDTTWGTGAGAVVMHSLARWRGDRVRLTLAAPDPHANLDRPLSDACADRAESVHERRRREPVDRLVDGLPVVGPKAA